MGVHGLWQLLQPAGRPVSLESLEGKVLAVDVSIWLHQTMKGMRDKDGNPLPNAHLQGLFSRVCKLLFYRIKPIFVFDGGVPMLKKQTMALRRERKAEAERESSEIAQKLLQNLIKSQAVKQTIGNSGSGPSRIPGVLKGRNQQENDLFELAPLPESEEIGLTLNAQEWERDFELQENWIKEGLAALSDAHPDSEEFRSLPMEIQHEILNELREQKKYHSLSRLTKMPENSDDFSSYQLKKLMKQSRLTVRIEEVRKQMSNKTAVDVTNDLGEDYYGDEVEARRIVSEDASHYVLIKGLTKKKQEEEAEKYEIHNKVKVEKVEDDEYDEDNGGIQFSSGAGRVKQENKPEILSASKDQSVKTFSSDSDSDIETVMARRLRKKRGQKKRKSSHGTLETKGMREKEGKTLEKVKSISGDGNKKSLKETDERNAVKPSTVAESSSEDEGFIEVTVHPEASMVEDELFPASIFQTVVEPDDKIIAAFNEQNQKKSLNEGSSIKISVDRVIIAEEQKEEKLTRTLPQSALVSEDNAAKRKSVLSDILSQLQEKRKNLSESLMEIETSPAPAEKNNDPKSSPAQTDEDFSGMKTSPAKADKDLNGTKIPPAQSEEDFNTSGGFLREESLEEEEHDHEFAKDKKNRNSPTKNLIPQVIPRDKTSEDNNEKRPRSPESGRLGDAGCASDSDEDLKLAIELSLQNMPPQLGKDNKVGESKVMNLENDDEDDDFEEVETTSSELQSSRISAKQTSLQAVDEIVSIVDDSEKNLPRDGAVNDQPNVAKNGSEQGQEHQKVTVTNSEVAQGRLQPEDFETEDDVDPYFHTLNEDDLMDINSELESERSALLLQRGQQNRMATSVTEQTSLDAQELLRLFGIPFIVSPMEAESQCAYLDVTDQTQGTITDDSDIWLFGGRRMYKNFFNQSKHVEFFTKDSIHNQFGIGREQLINIALLCGSDYTEGIQGVGPVRAMEIMAEFPGEGLEGLYMFRKWWDKARKKNMSNPESKIRARLKDLKLIPGFPSEAVVDAYLKPTVDESTERFTWGSPDLDMLREFAKYKFGWSKEKTDQSLLPMMKQLNKKESQGRIHSYFQPENFVQASKIKSERLKKALEMVKNPKQAAEPMETSENEEDDADNENFEKDVEDGTRAKKAQKRKDTNEKEDGDSRPAKEAKLKKKAESEGRANKKTVKKGKSVAVGEKQTKGNEVVNLVESQSITCSENLKPVERDEDDHVKSGLEEDAEVKVEDTMSKVQGLCREEMEEQFMQDMAEKVIHAKAKLEEMKGRGRGRGRGVKRGQDSVGGRGKVLLSLDQRPKSRKGQSARLKKVGSQKRGGGRGVVNLSESSSDSSDTEHDKNGSSGAVQITQVIPEKQFVKNSQGVKEKLYRTKLDVSKTVRNTVSESKAMESDAPLGTGKQTKVNIVSSFRDSSADTKAATRKKTVKNTSSSCVKGNSSGKTAASGGELNETAIPKSPQGTSGNTKTSAGSVIKIRPASGIKLDAGPESSSNLKGIGLKPPRNEKAAEPVAKASVYKSSQDSAEVADNKASARSVEMRQSGQDSSASRVENAEQEGDAEIDIRKADVSIINKQNLPATLTYLNRRSREDTFLLHQLKGSKAKNSVEQRLEESEKRSRYERSRSERQETPNSTISAASEEILSFEEMLGGMDDVVTQKVQKKTKKPQTKKSSDMNSLPGKDKLSKAKAIQEKIAKEVGHLRAAVVGDSEKMGFGQKSKVLNTDLAYQSEKGKSDVHESGLQGNVRKFNEENQMHKGVSKEMKSTKQKQKEEKVSFGSSDESMDWFDSPPSIAKSSQPDKETVSFKSHRSAAFDKPIGGDDDFDDDVVNDGNSRKYGKRNKFDKQLEHFADSKSVKGLGYLSSEMNVGRPQRGRAFAGKGKGRGKNRNRGFEEYHNTGVPHARPDVYASREVTLDEIAEYANVNADDLGSDFSDLET